MQITRKHKSL